MSFNAVLGKRPSRAKFNLSHERKLTLKMGPLYPILVQEVVPGDQMQVTSETMLRLAPMLSPVMARIDAYVHYFFVPNRLIWSKWEKFITGEEEVLIPEATVSGAMVKPGTIYDYMGLPTHGSDFLSMKFNVLPFRAYYLIYNEYYRDQNLSPKLPIEPDPGAHALAYRAWEKDYFTSALPWAQKGEAASLPIDHVVNYGRDGSIVVNTETGTPATNITALQTEGTGHLTRSPGPANLTLKNIDDIEANININELREATAIQRWLEKNARAGSRYVETLLAHFGVISDDARLQRPEYLGGGKTPVSISEVVNSTGFTELEPNALPQGALAGHGISVGRSNKATLYAKEHGYMIGILSVIPRTEYFQGMPKMYSRKTKLDFYWPEFAQLGEQEVQNQEIYHSGVSSADQQTFGYQARYAEYKHASSTVHGDFRKNLKFWHLAREFSACPTLQNIIRANPSDRIFAVTDGTDYIWAQVYNRIYARRPMPKYNVPTI